MEQETAGIRNETKHSMHRRAYFHDYSLPGVYMITITLEDRRPLFGQVADDEPARVVYSELGNKILTEEVQKMSAFYPNVEVLKFTLMPDHIHMIIKVKSAFNGNRHLGQVIRGFKTGCTRAWWSLLGGKAPSIVSGAFPPGERPGEWRPVLFSEGYNDRILLEEGQFERWCNYLDDNPRRLFLKRKLPDLFKVKYAVNIFGVPCETVGNGFLLNLPDKVAVIVHRSDDDAYYQKKVTEWLECGERGGVLVGAFISPREKAVKNEAENRGYRIIEILGNGFPAIYKPTGKAFDYCSAGLLLQVSQWAYHYDNRPISRRECLAMNFLAEKIVRGF